MKGSDNQEKLVYQIIEDAGNKGEYGKGEVLSAGLDLKKCSVHLFTRRSHPVDQAFILSIFWSGLPDI
jgi:hypothetical protein